MTWFQNPFSSDYKGIWVLADRRHTPYFNCPRNEGRGDDYVVVWNEPSTTYDLSGTDADSNNTDTLNIAIAPGTNDYKNWTVISLDISGSTPSATNPIEIVSAINADSTFSTYFTAKLEEFDSGAERITIRQKKSVTQFRFYVINGQAEEVLNFNSKAGVAELPTYFHRHIVWLGLDYDEQLSFTDGVNELVELDPDASGGASVVDDNIIDNAVNKRCKSLVYDSSVTQEDWDLLDGQSGLFQFVKGPSAGPVSTTETQIIFNAGASVGDLAKEIVTQLDASSVIVAVFSKPYTLTSSDLITPP